MLPKNRGADPFEMERRIPRLADGYSARPCFIPLAIRSPNPRVKYISANAIGCNQKARQLRSRRRHRVDRAASNTRHYHNHSIRNACIIAHIFPHDTRASLFSLSLFTLSLSLTHTRNTRWFFCLHDCVRSTYDVAPIRRKERKINWSASLLRRFDRRKIIPVPRACVVRTKWHFRSSK